MVIAGTCLGVGSQGLNSTWSVYASGLPYMSAPGQILEPSFLQKYSPVVWNKKYTPVILLSLIHHRSRR